MQTKGARLTRFCFSARIHGVVSARGKEDVMGRLKELVALCDDAGRVDITLVRDMDVNVASS